MRRIVDGNIQTKIIKIIASELGVTLKHIKEDTLIQEDLGADSLDIMNIAIAIENMFNVEIDEKTMMEFHTVGTIVKQLSSMET